MKCTNRYLKKRIIGILVSSLFAAVLGGCGSSKYDLPYDVNSAVSGFNVVAEGKSDVTDAFAVDLCISTEDVINAELANISNVGSAVLFDVNNAEILYSENAHVKLSPASLTKVLTALVALKHGTPDMILHATDAVNVNESGAQLCGLKAGDTMTLNQALHIALLQSANDAALLIAENIGGSVENFVKMMNDEARALGATNSNFVNPHGLTDAEQYTTAYDLYLIFNEAIKQDKFVEIIQMTSYETTYYDGAGEAKQLSVRNTNRFVNGDAKVPDNATIIGGKTGTTNAAGHCLMLLSKDTNGAPYISIILKASSRDELYAQMTDLLDEIGK